MQVKDIMSKSPQFLSPTATLAEAARLMAELDSGFLPVGENDRLVGALTDRDIIIRVLAKNKDINKTLIKDAMSQGIHFCFETDDLRKAATQMEELQIRRLVVLNKDKRMVGIISLGDIATRSKDRELCGEITDAISQH